jgi:hypothetical protein
MQPRSDLLEDRMTQLMERPKSKARTRKPTPKPERPTLARCEKRIAENVERKKLAYIAIGQDLRLIRDKGLYKASYGSFDEYCRLRWEWDRHYAHRVITAADLAEVLPMDNMPQNERQARALERLEGDVAAQRTVMARVFADNARVTGKIIEKAVTAYLAETEGPVTLVDVAPGADYVEPREATEARYANQTATVPMQDVTLLYPLEQFAKVKEDVTKLKAAWEMDAPRDVIAEALSRAVASL